MCHCLKLKAENCGSARCIRKSQERPADARDDQVEAEDRPLCSPVALSSGKSPHTHLPGLNTTVVGADHVVLPVIIKNFPYTCSIVARSNLK
jgi:hypothetical protein